MLSQVEYSLCARRAHRKRIEKAPLHQLLRDLFDPVLQYRMEDVCREIGRRGVLAHGMHVPLLSGKTVRVTRVRPDGYFYYRESPAGYPLPLTRVDWRKLLDCGLLHAAAVKPAGADGEGDGVDYDEWPGMEAEVRRVYALPKRQYMEWKAAAARDDSWSGRALLHAALAAKARKAQLDRQEREGKTNV